MIITHSFNDVPLHSPFYLRYLYHLIVCDWLYLYNNFRVYGNKGVTVVGIEFLMEMVCELKTELFESSETEDHTI